MTRNLSIEIVLVLTALALSACVGKPAPTPSEALPAAPTGTPVPANPSTPDPCAPENLPAEVRRDPQLALDGGDDGLDLARRLSSDLPRLLRPCGAAVLEVGDDQAEVVAELAYRFGLGVARRVQDVGGAERVIVLQPR